MSMNLHLEATILLGHLDESEVTEEFDLYQTPTRVTYEAMAAENPMAVYSNWCKQYDDAVQCHLKRLQEWMEEHRGWEVKWFMM